MNHSNSYDSLTSLDDCIEKQGMKRSNSEKPHDHRNPKTRRVIRTSYYGAIIDGKREGIHRIRIEGSNIIINCPFVNGIKKGYSYSFIESNGKLINYSFFENDHITKQVDLLTEKTITGILDYGDGSRWEGAICNNRTSGFGCLYSPNNYLIYQGMSVDNKREGYGTSYYELVDKSDNPVICYEGEWTNDCYSGHGRFFDRKGNLLADADWFNGKLIEYQYTVHKEDSHVSIHTHIQELTVSADCLNELVHFDINNLEHLKRLQIADNCLQSVQSFTVRDHHSLQELHIGKHCFSSVNQDWETLKHAKSDNKRIQKTVLFSSIPHLRVISIGENSFMDYTSFSINGMNGYEK